MVDCVPEIKQNMNSQPNERNKRNKSVVIVGAVSAAAGERGGENCSD